MILQFINVMATNNYLLMDELNVSYFASKLWLYVVIWLPRTTDNSTHFAQSLNTEPRSAVGNVSGYRCMSDCRSRGREFDPGPAPYFRKD